MGTFLWPTLYNKNFRIFQYVTESFKTLINNPTAKKG